MATDICTRRLTKELKAYQKDPITEPVIRIAPNERNILEMHYVIEGSKGTPYEGGIYHGKLLFPKQYPLKPPGVMILTPNGRFQPGRRLCLSMSDFHPENWNPMWSVSTILTGLYSFMIESNPTLGSVETSYRKKRQLAAASLEYNVKHGDALFPKLFPEYVDRYHEDLEEKKKKEAERAAGLARLGVSSSASSTNPLDLAMHRGGGVGGAGGMVAGLDFIQGFPQGLAAALAGVVALLSIALAYRFF